MKRADWRIIQISAFIAITLASAVYLFAGMPIKRPLALFFLTGFALTTPAIQYIVRKGHPSTSELVTTLTSTILGTALLFLTLWNRVLFAGSDMAQHITLRAGHIMQTGYINPDIGMYTHSPLIHIEYSVIARLTGLWVFEVRFPFLALSIFTPLLIFLVCQDLKDASTGVLGAALGAAFPLFYRVGATFDSETLALPLFIVSIYLTLKWVGRPDRRLSLLIVGLLIGGAYIHFLYPILIFGFLLGGAILTYATRQVSNYSKSHQRITIPMLSLFIGAFFIAWRVFWTKKGQNLFLSLVIKGSQTSIPTNPLRLFLPSGGAVGRTTTSTTAGSDQAFSVISALINFAPMLLFVFFGAIGGLVLLNQSFDNDQAATFAGIAVIASLLTTVALVALTSASSFRLGFRFYYFIGVIGLICCGIGSAYLLQPPDIISDASRIVIAIIAVVLIASFAITGPLSSLGNPVDSRFGGTTLYTDETDVRHLSALDEHTPVGTEPVPVRLERIELPNVANPVSPSYRGTELRTVTSSNACRTKMSPWSSGRFSYCFH